MRRVSHWHHKHRTGKDKIHSPILDRPIPSECTETSNTTASSIAGITDHRSLEPIESDRRPTMPKNGASLSLSLGRVHSRGRQSHLLDGLDLAHWLSRSLHHLRAQCGVRWRPHQLPRKPYVSKATSHVIWVIALRAKCMWLIDKKLADQMIARVSQTGQSEANFLLRLVEYRRIRRQRRAKVRLAAHCLKNKARKWAGGAGRPLATHE